MTKPDAINLLRGSRIARLPPRPAQGARRQRAGGSSPARTRPPANTPKAPLGGPGRCHSACHHQPGAFRIQTPSCPCRGLGICAAWLGMGREKRGAGTQRHEGGARLQPHTQGIWGVDFGCRFWDGDHFAIIPAVRRVSCAFTNHFRLCCSTTSPPFPRTHTNIPKTPFFSCVSPRQQLHSPDPVHCVPALGTQGSCTSHRGPQTAGLAQALRTPNLPQVTPTPPAPHPSSGANHFGVKLWGKRSKLLHGSHFRKRTGCLLPGPRGDAFGGRMARASAGGKVLRPHCSKHRAQEAWKFSFWERAGASAC